MDMKSFLNKNDLELHYAFSAINDYQLITIKYFAIKDDSAKMGFKYIKCTTPTGTSKKEQREKLSALLRGEKIIHMDSKIEHQVPNDLTA